MAYIGQDIEGGVLEKQTLPANGVLTSFDLDYFSDANGLIVSVQGVVQEPGVAYTVSGKKINFTSAPSATTYVVFIERELTVASVLPNDWIDYQTGTANGSATPLTLSHSTSDPEDIMVTLNGLTQRPTTDYTVSGTTLTFTTAPTSGMIITVYHLRLTKVDGVPLDGTVTDSKIVSMNAAKLTGSLPISMTPALSKQFRAMSAVALHWASVENKVAMNLQQDFLDHFQDDSGWVAYNGPVITTPSSASDWAGNTSGNTFSSGRVFYTNGGNPGDEAVYSATTVSGDFEFQVTVTQGQQAGAWVGVFASAHLGTFNGSHETGNMHSMNDAYFYAAVSRAGQTAGFTARTGGSATNTAYSSANGDVVKIKRVGSTITQYLNGTLKATANGVPTGTMHLCLGGGGASSSSESDYTSITWTTSPAAVNTGSENVGRNSTDEYMSSIYTSYGSSTVLNENTLSGDTITFHSNGNDGLPSWTKGVTYPIGTANNIHYLYHTPSGGAYTWYWNTPTTSNTPGAGTGFVLDYGQKLRFIDFKMHRNTTAGEVMSFRLQYSDDNSTWTNFDLTGSTFAASPELTALGEADNIWSTSTKDANGIFSTTTASSSGDVTGSLWTPATPIEARYIRFDLLTYANRGNANVGWSNFIPTVQTITSSTNATGKVVSTSQTADATVSEATGVMLYDDGGNTSTIGTDLKTYFSSDNGTNWTEAASYGNPVTFAGTTKLIPLGETTLTGGTGTSVKMKAEFANQQGASSEQNTASVITAYGDVQHSTALVDSGKIGKSCMKFTGNGGSSPTSHLSIPHSDDFDFPNDFTVEFWFNTVASDHSGNGGTMLSRHHAGLTTTQIGFRDSSNGQLMAQAHNVNQLFGPTGLHDGNWHHLAWVRSGTGSNNIKIYVDGAQQHQYTSTNPWFRTDASSPIYIGSYGNSEYFGGKIDEVRISDNARYTSNFTPSTTAFTSDSNTVVLVHSDTAHGSTTFTDSSSNGYTITPTAVSHFNSAPPTGGSAIRFDGNGDYLTIPHHNRFNFGFDDFTIEFDMMLDQTSPKMQVIEKRTSGSAGGIQWNVQIDTNGVVEFGHSNSANYASVISTVPSINTWYRVACVKKGLTLGIFMNGVAGNTTTHSWTHQHHINTPIQIGKSSHSISDFKGYLDEIRISSIARYTPGVNYTPSPTKFVTDNQTLLLIHSDDVNGSTTFTSDEVKTNLIRSAGDAQHSNYVAKVGRSGIKFDGSGDKLQVAASSDFQVASSDPYTIEFWFKMNIAGNNTYPQRMQFMGGGTWTSAGTPTSWVIDYQHNTNNDNQYIRWARYGTNASYTWGNAADTEWHHLAIVMPGNGTQKLYLDGTYRASASVGDTWHTASDPILIGMSGLTGQDMNGYMDEIRISSVARYSADFTPSTTAFTSDANTLLLIHSDDPDGGLFQDSSSNSHPVVDNGTVTHSSTQKKFGDTSIYFQSSTGNSLSIPDSSDWYFEDDDFTIECWVWLASLPSTNIHGNVTFELGGQSTSDTSDVGGSWHWLFNGYPSGSQGRMQFNTYQRNGTNTNDDLTLDSHSTGNGVPSTSQWIHCALVRQGNTIRMYMNGVELMNGNIPNTNSYKLTANDLGGQYWISRRAYNPGYGYIDGYIDDYRISNVCRYPDGTTFTPHTSAHVSDANTLLLISDKSSQDFIDSSSNNRTITRANNVIHKTIEKKIGTSSIYFDGTGDYLDMGDLSTWLLTGNFTFEAWLYHDNNNSHASVFSKYTSGSCNGIQFYLCRHSNNAHEFTFSNGSTCLTTSYTSAMAAKTWYHIAAAYNGTTIGIWENGVSKDTTAGTVTMAQLDTNFYIGSDRPNYTRYWNGYMDEIRISDVARYTPGTNFTPATSAFTADANTILLMHGDDSGKLFTDSSYTTGKQTQLHGWAVNY